MKIHEYQAKALLAAAGVPVPKGILVHSPQEAVAAFKEMGGIPVVLKAQIHAGGRSEGHFKDYDYGAEKKWGGVKRFLTTPEAVASFAEVMFKHVLVTKQTGPEGKKILKLLVVDAGPKISREIYVGIVLDRGKGMPVLMASADGGVDIEKTAVEKPEAILKTYLAPETGILPFQARKVAFDLGFTGDQIPKAEAIITALAKIYFAKDCTLAEINPLVVRETGAVEALDAKFDFDDNAIFRHKDIQELRDLTEENPAEIRAGKANLNFIQLDGNIGCLVNGAGLAMGTMDIINYHKGSPANFLDVGGGVTAEGASEAFRIILSDPKVKGILVNIFGGIAKCDLIAEALVKAGREVGFKVPVVVRLEGTNSAKAREILKAVKTELPMIQSATDLTEAAKMVVTAAK
jgi:succinyl-CoA synthetase beta subunit